MAQELGEVKDIIRFIYQTECLDVESNTGYFIDDTKNYRLWGFQFNAYWPTPPAELAGMDLEIRVNGSHDAIVYHFVDRIQYTFIHDLVAPRGIPFSRTYRKEFRYYEIGIWNFSPTLAAYFTLSTRKGN